MNNFALLFVGTVLLSAACSEARDRDHLESLREEASIDCGSFTVNGCPSVPESALNCIQGGLDQGQTAKLQQTFTSDEGGQVIEYLFTVDSGGPLLRIVDSRADPLGAQTVEEHACSGVAFSGPTVSGCEYVVATGCAE